MRKTFVALSALVVGGGLATSAYAQTTPSTSINYNNDLNAAVSAESYNYVDISIAGNIKIKGAVDVAAVGHALVDGKQLLNNNTVEFVNPGTGSDSFGTFSNFVTVTNSAQIGDTLGAFTGATGNIGVSVAAGDSIAQDNAAAITAVRGASAAVKTDVVKLQEAINNTVGSSSQGAAIIVNNATIVSGSFSNASGNVGANVAAGYNIGQQNSLAVAVAEGTAAGATADISLASANVGVLQNVNNNNSYVANNTNTAAVGTIGLFFSGNAGINAAAGGNLVQNNSLAVSSN